MLLAVQWIWHCTEAIFGTFIERLQSVSFQTLADELQLYVSDNQWKLNVTRKRWEVDADYLPNSMLAFQMEILLPSGGATQRRFLLPVFVHRLMSWWRWEMECVCPKNTNRGTGIGLLLALVTKWQFLLPVRLHKTENSLSLVTSARSTNNVHGTQAESLVGQSGCAGFNVWRRHVTPNSTWGSLEQHKKLQITRKQGKINVGGFTNAI